MEKIQNHALILGLVLAWITLVLSQGSKSFEQDSGTPCYEQDANGEELINKPRQCLPPFENVVAGKMVNVTPAEMTCGLRSPIKYCIQTIAIYRECEMCDDGENKHPASYLTDTQEKYDETWWQSVTMLEDVHGQDIHLTVNLGMAYDITFVRLKFHSPRPASFAIYKKMRRNPVEEDPYPNEDWIPWQYYSITCRDTYGIDESSSVIQPRDGKTKINEDRALCTAEFSDMTPLKGGSVAFSTLDGRPSAYNFDDSKELQQWVSATDIRISLKRLNTFGDEVFGDHKVLQSYYYAITDFTVGGRCHCNGHAPLCVPNTDPSDKAETAMICLCQHNTAGPNCDRCMDDHWDLPYKRATSRSANACKRCECNDWSARCRFNEEFYRATGRGGECMDCGGNRDGQHCERCKADHYESPVQDDKGRTPCEPCNCDPIGSEVTQCDPQGKCQCRKGVTGDKCDQCAPNHWKLGSNGCESCDCYREGSLDNTPQCDTNTGICSCKQNVEGQKCDRPKVGHFHIGEDNEFGATPCFCYGHTLECELSGGYVKSSIISDFSRNDEKWKTFEDGADAPVKHDPINKYIGIQSVSSNGAFFSAPSVFLGNQRHSYNQELSFKLRINDVAPVANPDDIIIMSGGAKASQISLSITGQGNFLPTNQMQLYTFRLHENPEFGWTPRLSAQDFMAVLSNITAIKIRGSYVEQGIGFIDNVKLETAIRGSSGEDATWVERCQCPDGYQGQFCQLCVDGYYHENNGGPFARCIPCQCNGHADICDAESGKCACEHNTDGQNCEKCAKGFYGNALAGTPNDCEPCPCPEGGACIEVPGEIQSPICTECPPGRTGARCEECEDGYFGDPAGKFGPVRPCQKCDCNNNVDPSKIGNCDRLTGVCTRCIDNTDGDHCERCKSGFFGDALALKKPGDPPNCQPCQCYPIGTNMALMDDSIYLPICNGFTGDCSCKPHVDGRDCDKCADGYFNIDSDQGCEPCNCDTTGSVNQTCHVVTGQCFCNPGVTGKTCADCLPKHYGFNSSGCTECDCDPNGSLDLQCDEISGQCKCRDKVVGKKCDRCMENTKTKDTGGFGEKICEPCDDCYNLVSDAANAHRANLEELEGLLKKIAESPEPVEQDFLMEVRQLGVQVTFTLAEARINSKFEDGGTLRDRLEDLTNKLRDVVELVADSDRQIGDAQDKSKEATENVKQAREIIERAKESLKNAQKMLENDAREALRKAEERSKKFGEESDKMSAIARDARLLAERQVEDASEIEFIATQAKETSKSAYEMARGAMDDQHKTGNQIKVLEVQVNDMGKKLQKVQSLSVQTSKDAMDAYNSAINIFQRAKSLEVPSIDEENIEKQAKRVREEAQRIKDEANRLIDSNVDLLQETQDRRVQLEDLLGRAQSQQQTLDAQLAEMDKHAEKAKKAVENGNAVLSDAEKTLQTLNDFDNTVKANKEAALRALNEVDRINEVIQQAVDKTAEARNSMIDADTNAKLALNVARDAETISKEASEKAKEIREKAAESRDSASELAGATASLTAKLDETKGRLQTKEEIAASDGMEALNALEKANQAQNKAKEASMKVEKAKKELDDIKTILSTVQEPEVGLLEELKRRVESAEETFKAAQLDARLQEFEEARRRQGEQMRDLERELEYMREESANIKSIHDSLPTLCSKNSELCLEDKC